MNDLEEKIGNLQRRMDKLAKDNEVMTAHEFMAHQKLQKEMKHKQEGQQLQLSMYKRAQRNKTVRAINDLSESQIFAAFISLVILGNTTVLAMDRHPMSS